MNQFDKILWRFNGILIALACVGSLISISIVTLMAININPTAPKSIKHTSEKLPEYKLSQISQIHGSNLFVATLALDSLPRFSRLSLSSSYDGTAYRARNYLFFDSSTGKSHWLAENNDSLFLENHEMQNDPDATHSDRKTISFIYETVPAKLFAEKPNTLRTMLFYNLADRNLKPLANNIQHVLRVQQISKDKAIIFFNSDDKTFALTINPKTGEQIDKWELPAILADKSESN